MMKLRILGVVLALSGAGCFQLEEEYFLNPDGSGKVIVRWSGPLSNEADEIEEEVKRHAGRFLRRSKGIECWKDVSYEVLKDGRFSFRGTAYFRNIDEADLFGMGEDLSPYQIRRDPKVPGGFHIPLPEVPKPAQPLEGKELEKAVQKERIEHVRDRSSLRMVLPDFRWKRVFHLSGPIVTARHFKPHGPSAVVMEVDGARLLRLWEDHVADDAKFLQTIAAGWREEQGLPPAVLETYLGGADNPQIVTGKPQADSFDYQAEVTDPVREQYRALLESFPEEEDAGPPEAMESDPDLPTEPFEDVLKSGLGLDWHGDQWIKALVPADSLWQRLQSADNEDYDYSLDTPRGSSSSSGSDRRKFLRMGFRNSGLEHLEIRHLEGSLRFQVAPGKESLVVTSDVQDCLAILGRGGGRITLRMITGRGGFTGSWKSIEEAIRTNPVEFGLIREALNFLPLQVALSALDEAVVRAAMNWDEGLAEADKDFLEKLCRGLSDEASIRETRAKELGEAVRGRVSRMRYLQEKSNQGEDLELRARIAQVLRSLGREGEGVQLAASQNLYRDLEYLAAFLASPEHAFPARARLSFLVGMEFGTLQEFKVWHSAHRDRLKWDPVVGRYTTGR